MEGLTGFIVFDKGLRSFFHLSITELSPEGLLPVGTWNKENKANFTRKVVESTIIQDSTLANKTFIVTSILVKYNNMVDCYNYLITDNYNIIIKLNNKQIIII